MNIRPVEQRLPIVSNPCRFLANNNNNNNSNNIKKKDGEMFHVCPYTILRKQLFFTLLRKRYLLHYFEKNSIDAHENKLLCAFQENLSVKGNCLYWFAETRPRFENWTSAHPPHLSRMLGSHLSREEVPKIAFQSSIPIYTYPCPTI